MEKQFPVLNHEKYKGCPASIPWSLIEPHAEQAKKNHDQTLEQLAARGGLGAAEIIPILKGKSYSEFWAGIPNLHAFAVMKLIRLVHPETASPIATVKSLKK